MANGVDQDRQELIAELNQDLAGEYRIIAGYTAVIALLRVEVANHQRRARILADMVAGIGGEPSETSQPIVLTCDPREMLEQIRRAESASFANVVA